MAQTKAQLVDISTTGISAGSASTPGITFIGDLNTGIYSPGADQVAISTNGTARVTVNSSGNVGIGTTSPGATLHVSGSNVPLIVNSNSANTSTIIFQVNGSAKGYVGPAGVLGGSDNDMGYRVESGNSQVFYIGSTERARLDSSGRLLVGTSTSASTTANVVVQGSSNGQLELRCATDPSSSGTALGVLRFTNNSGGLFAQIYSESDGTISSSSDLPGRLVFSTTADGASSPTERMRITSSGDAYIGSTAPVWDERLGVIRTANNVVAGFYSTSSSYTTSVVRAQAETAPGTGWQLFQGRDDGGTINFNVYGNGNVQNTNNSYGSLSDIKLKENIVDASSQWEDLKALQIRNYNLKEGQTHRQIGLIAQEAELVSPGLVYETPDQDAEGNDLGTVTKSVNYSVLYMKAVKALQEAMERIEQLEAEMAEVKAQLS